jgi:hypothetical protein
VAVYEELEAKGWTLFPGADAGEVRAFITTLPCDRTASRDELLARINQGRSAAARQVTEKRVAEKFEERRRQLRAKREDVVRMYDERAQLNQQRRELRLRQVQQVHDNAVQDFKDKWQNPHYVGQFGRPSPQLIDVRRAERKLALAGLYDQAKRTREAGDALQTYEEQETRSQLTQRSWEEFRKLREKQRAEIEKINAHHDGIGRDCEVAKRKELAPIDSALAAMGQKQAAGMSSRAYVCRSRAWESQAPPDISARCQTPGTQDKYRHLRQPRHVKLNLQPLDESDFSRLTEPPGPGEIKGKRLQVRPATAARSSARSSARVSAAASRASGQGQVAALPAYEPQPGDPNYQEPGGEPPAQQRDEMPVPEPEPGYQQPGYQEEPDTGSAEASGQW